MTWPQGYQGLEDRTGAFDDAIKKAIKTAAKIAPID